MTELLTAPYLTSTRANSFNLPDFPYMSLSYERSNTNIIDIDFSREKGHFGSNALPQPGNSAIERSIVLRSFSILVSAQPVRRREQTLIAGYAFGS